MSRDRERAERCFALARSTTFPGERESAVTRGLAILEKAGLDPDDFDIPGRSPTKARKPPPSAFREDLFRPGRSPFYGANGTREDFADVMRRFAEGMRQAQEAEFRRQWRADSDDFLSGYRKRREEELRRKQTEEEARARKAADYLSARGWRVYPAGVLSDSSDWIVEHEDSLEPYSSEALIRFAERHGFDS